MKIATYDTDLTRHQWHLLRRFLPAAKNVVARAPRLREVINSSLTVSATGAQPIDYYWFKGSQSNPVGGNADTLNFAPLAGTNSTNYL
jgi:transposase